MNLIAGLLILACLLGSEWIGAAAADDVAVRLFAVAVTAAGGARGRVLSNCRFDSENEFRSIAADRQTADVSPDDGQSWGGLVFCQSGDHLALRWQDVVRGNWRLDRWPLVDELVILFPVLLPMVISWGIFYQLQRVLGRRRLASQVKPRLSQRKGTAPAGRMEGRLDTAGWNTFRCGFGFTFC